MQGAIFDLDGTLLDSMDIWVCAASNYVRSKNLIPDDDLDEQVLTLSLRQAAEFLIPRYGLTLSPEQISDEINRQVEKRYFYQVPAKDGVSDFLESLARRGVKMCIATATDRYQVEAALKRCGLDSFFSDIFTCTQAGGGKESPAVFRLAQNHLNLSTEEIAVFEDAVHAIHTAKREGFFTVGIEDRYQENNRDEIIKAADCFLSSWRDPQISSLLKKF